MAFTRYIDVINGQCTKVKNHNLIKKNEVEMIRKTLTECLKKYDLHKSNKFIINSIEISKRLKTSAGICLWTKSDTPVFDIKLAHNNYVEFGAESMDKTLRHEIAHLIEVVLYKKSGHSDRFKNICTDLGGHMNAKMAGKKYSNSSTSNYCKKSYRYKYKCSCGMSFKRKRVINNFNTLRSRCTTCQTMVMDMKMEKL